MAITFRDRAIVLRITPMRDADRRYLVYSRDHGKIGLLAKGTRRGRSKMSPHMAWFGSVDIMVAKGRVFDRLAGASLKKPFSGILESLPKAALAQGFLMTVDSLTRQEQPDRHLFALIEEFLGALETSIEHRSVNGRGPLFDAAVLKLLDITGFGPELDRCVSCRQNFNGGVAMSFYRGGLECSACRQSDSLLLLPETVSRLRRFRSEPLSASVAEPPPFQATARIIEALLMNQVEERYTAMRFMRQVA